jgi:hypothetical protein
MAQKAQKAPQTTTYDWRNRKYDYRNQAWVVDGVYVRCGHPDCSSCYGTQHEGERPDPTNKDIE